MNIKNIFKINQISKINFFLIFIFTSLICWVLNLSLGLNTLESILKSHWQILDLSILFSDPVNSILYLHSQPPLLNAILIFLNKVGGSIYENFVFFNSILIGCIASLIFKILFDISKNLPMSLLLSFCFIIYPTTLLNIGYPFYQCISAFGYMLLLYSFHLTNINQLRSIICFSIACILLSLTRSSFTILHTFIFIVIFYFYTFNFRFPSKNFIILISLTVILSLIVPFKNLFLYNFFGTSSWAPINIAKGFGVPRQEGYMLSPNKILEIYPTLECADSYHFQDINLIKTNGEANYNSCIILEYAKIIKEEKLSGYDLKLHFKRILSNTVQYFSPSDKYFFLKNRDSIKSYANIVNYIQLTIPLTSKIDSRELFIHEVRIILLILLGLGIFYSFTSRDKFLSICIIIILIHFFTHVFTDGSESKRFVFDIEFIFFILIGLIVKSIQDYKKI